MGELLRAFGQQAAFINAEVIPWVLRLVMVGMGLTLTLADFRRVVKYPTAVTIGVLGQIIDCIVVAGLLVVIVNVLTMVFGYALARLFQLPIPQVVTIVFEVGIQNLSLALAITFRMMNRPDLAVAALLYAVVMPATALTFVSIARPWIAREAASVPAVASRL